MTLSQRSWHRVLICIVNSCENQPISQWIDRWLWLMDKIAEEVGIRMEHEEKRGGQSIQVISHIN